jgi:hypothetical protein
MEHGSHGCLASKQCRINTGANDAGRLSRTAAATHHLKRSSSSAVSGAPCRSLGLAVWMFGDTNASTESAEKGEALQRQRSRAQRSAPSQCATVQSHANWNSEAGPWSLIGIVLRTCICQCWGIPTIPQRRPLVHQA